MAERKTPDEWGQDYRVLRPSVIAFTADLRRLVGQLLDAESIDVANIEHRTKEVDSFVEKIRRKNEKYEDPLGEVTDLCGLRIVAYYLDDVDRIGELVEREFVVDLENSVRYRA